MKLKSFVLHNALLWTVLLASSLFFLQTPQLHANEAINFKMAKQAFERGDFSTANKIFHALIKQQAGDPELDFFLGRSAFESGDFETASFAFERVLIAQPQADRARLELARCYFEMGSLVIAESNFKQVLVNNPPPPVRQNIHRYLDLIEKMAQQHSFSGLVSVGISFDGNIHSSPVDQQIQTIIGNVTLSGNGSAAQEDFINQNSIQLNHLYRKHPKSMGWLSSAMLHNSTYADEQNLNLNLFGLNTGPVWQNGQWQTRLQGQFNHLILDDKRYMTLAGFTAEQTWLATPSYNLGLTAQFSYLDYANSDRDAEIYHLEFKQSKIWGKNRLSASFGVEFNQSDKDHYSYIRELLSISYQRQLPWQVQAELDFRYYHSDHDESEPLFSDKRQEDFHEFRAGLSRPLWHSKVNQQQLRAQLQYAYTDTDSNIGLYKYNKQVANFVLSYLF